MTRQERLIGVQAAMEHMIDQEGLPRFDEWKYDPGAAELLFLWHEAELGVVVELDDGARPDQQVAAALGLPVMH